MIREEKNMLKQLKKVKKGQGDEPYHQQTIFWPKEDIRISQIFKIVGTNVDKIAQIYTLNDISS